MPRPITQTDIWRYAARIRTRGERPAAVIIGSLWRVKKKGRSGKITFPLADNLERKLLTLGNIGARRNGNSIGYCAEVDASNKLLLQHNLRRYKLGDIDFSPALRPRTMQVIPPCQNCVDTFR